MPKPIKIQLVFGESACHDISDNRITDEVIHGFNEYEFATQAEADAFLQGVEAGNGWLAYHVPEANELRRIRDKIRRDARKAA